MDQVRVDGSNKIFISTIGMLLVRFGKVIYLSFHQYPFGLYAVIRVRLMWLLFFVHELAVDKKIKYIIIQGRRESILLQSYISFMFGAEHFLFIRLSVQPILLKM